MPPSDPCLARQNAALKLKGHGVTLDVAGGRVRPETSPSSSASVPVLPTQIRPRSRCSWPSNWAMPWNGIASG